MHAITKSGQDINRLVEEKRNDVLSKIKPAGQLSCLIVYSDVRHVSYINELINWIEEVVPKMGFSVNRLCLKALPDEHFGQLFEKLADDCAFAIVILDGLRPNVLFEYGYLRGKGKVVLPIQDKEAFISVKTLYTLPPQAEEKQTQLITGLTRTQFSKLLQPPIGCFGQISDRHGIKVVEVDRHSESSSILHPKQVLQTEISKLMPKILQAYANQSVLTTTPIQKPEYLQEFQELTLVILRYYTRVEKINQESLGSITKSIGRLEKISGINLPSMTYGFVAILHASLAEQFVLTDIEVSLKEYTEAIKLWKKVLKIDKSTKMQAYSSTNLGIIYLEISRINDSQKILEESVKSFKKALNFSSKADQTIDKAMIKYNLSSVYIDIADKISGESRESYLNEAIKTLQEISPFLKEKSIQKYIICIDTLGIAYSRLSEIKERDTLLGKAEECFNGILGLIDKNNSPFEYAHTLHQLGNVYLEFSEVNNGLSNIIKAENLFIEALTIYKKKEKPVEYASCMFDLATVYGKLTDYEKDENKKESFSNKSIDSLEEALTVYNIENRPIQYAKAKENLGIAYAKSVSTIQSKKERVKRIHKAISSIEEALRILKIQFPFGYALGQMNIGNLYGTLSAYSKDGERYLLKAITSYEESLIIFSTSNFPYEYGYIKHNMGCAYNLLSRRRDRETNLNKAIECFDDALNIFTKDKFPEKFEELMDKLNNTTLLLGRIK
jgi:tetratricopeptide (TPR) repeat protein